MRLQVYIEWDWAFAAAVAVFGFTDSYLKCEIYMFSPKTADVWHQVEFIANSKNVFDFPQNHFFKDIAASFTITVYSLSSVIGSLLATVVVKSI